MTHDVTTKELANDPGVVWPETRRGQMDEFDLSEDQVIDPTVLAMLAALPKAVDMVARVHAFEQQMSSKMSLLRAAVGAHNCGALEDIASEISRQAITVGAVKILKLSYELQSLARCGAYEEAGRISCELEVAFTQAQESLRQAI